MADEAPDWSYPGCPAAAPAAAADDLVPLDVPGSAIHYTAAALRRLSIAPDWFPAEHREPPAVVMTGQTPATPACGYCHLPDGGGRPENVRIAGLPAAYIATQIAVLRSGERHGAPPDWAPSRLMVKSLGTLSDAQVQAAAIYYSQQAVRSHLQLVETADVPHVTTACFVLIRSKGPDEPLGTRIVETPTDVERFERRDPHASYLVYVPVGSIERGRNLAAGAGLARPQACATCHGVGLRGGAALPAPPLAGQFPGYLFRQLYAFQAGTRAGAASLPMQTVTASLSVREMIDLAAYAASLPP